MRWLTAHITVIALWIVLHARVASWLARSWLEQEGWLHAALAALGLLALGRSLDPVAILDRLALPPRGSMLALALAVGPPVAAAVAWTWLPVELVVGVAAVLSAYGVAGLFLDAASWRRLAPAALLGAAVLPTTGHLDVFLGFPLRSLIAQVVARLLSAADVTAATVLTIDGAYAHVDLPCSGVRSLWSGLVVLIGAAVAWGRPVAGRFVAIAVLMCGLLVAANGSRVLALVALEHVAGIPLLAEVLHLPLGVVGFVGAVGIALGLLHRTAAPPVASAGERRRAWPTPLLALGLLATMGIATVLGDGPAPAAPPPVALPAGLDPIAASPEEVAFATQHGGQIRKARFDGGTVVLVVSRSWLAHHSPTQCLEAGGWSLVEDRPVRIDGGGVRVASAARGPDRATALWWYQSPDQQTDDHTVRVLSGLHSDAPWVLISVLFEGDVHPDAPAVAPLIDELRASVAHSLETS